MEDSLFFKLLKSNTYMSRSVAKSAMKVHYKERIILLESLQNEINKGKDAGKLMQDHKIKTEQLLDNLYTQA